MGRKEKENEKEKTRFLEGIERSSSNKISHHFFFFFFFFFFFLPLDIFPRSCPLPRYLSRCPPHPQRLLPSSSLSLRQAEQSGPRPVAAANRQSSRRREASQRSSWRRTGKEVLLRRRWAAGAASVLLGVPCLSRGVSGVSSRKTNARKREPVETSQRPWFAGATNELRRSAS
ncbi:hypothetical protein DFJ73DRAFT_141290 [Zopfochytrium polystomum]|nr:hypothetical protein DFJ73DRAFT_141290 [Zopfochytrium polystomum]